MPQLLGIDDRADGGNLPTGDVERHHAGQPARAVEHQGAGLPVYLDLTYRSFTGLKAVTCPVQQRMCGAAATVRCPRQGGCLATAVDVQHHPFGQVSGQAYRALQRCKTNTKHWEKFCPQQSVFAAHSCSFTFRNSSG